MTVRFGVMGAGSIGCFVGARLQASGAPVHFVGRSSVGDEVGAHGMTATSFDGSATRVASADIAWSEDPAALSACDVALVCVKSLATAAVGAQLAPILRSDCVVLSLQNGVSNAETLAAELGPRVVYPCMVPFNVVRLGEGRFHQGTSGRLATTKTLSPDIVAAFEQAGLELEQHDDMRAVLWGKLLINLNNAINALADVPLQQQLSDRVWRRVMARNVAEGLAVLRAEGVRPVTHLPVPVAWIPRLLRLPTWLFTRVAKRMVDVDPEARSSMWEDLQRGRRTEVDVLNGEVVALAERHGVDTPLNRLIVEAIHGVESGDDVHAYRAALRALA